MKSRKILVSIVILSGISLLITIAAYFLNTWLLSFSNLSPTDILFVDDLSPTDALFVEGMLFIIAGLLLLLGRGGINLGSQRAAILSALAGAVYGEDTVGPAEIFRRDVWKPKGFIRIALIFILAGVFMILTYFLTL